MKKLARRQNEDSQQSGTKDKKSGSAAVSKNSSKRSTRDDDTLRQYRLYRHSIVNFPDLFEFSVSSTRGHAYKLYKYRCNSVRAHFFACRVVNVWNSLPESVVFTSLSAFKQSIRTFDFSVFLKCNSMLLNRAAVSAVDDSLVVLLMYLLMF